MLLSLIFADEPSSSAVPSTAAQAIGRFESTGLDTVDWEDPQADVDGGYRSNAAWEQEKNRALEEQVLRSLGLFIFLSSQRALYEEKLRSALAKLDPTQGIGIYVFEVLLIASINDWKSVGVWTQPVGASPRPLYVALLISAFLMLSVPAESSAAPQRDKKA
jgi:hypothetical protein